MNVALTTQTDLHMQVPMYSFKESKRVGYREQEVPKSRVVIVEGIYALSSKIRCAAIAQAVSNCAGFSLSKLSL